MTTSVSKLARIREVAFARAATLQNELYSQSRVLIVGLAIAAVLLPVNGAFAQAITNTIDTTALNKGVNSIVGSIQAVCIIALPLLFVAGGGVLIFSGFSDNFRRISIRIIGFAFMGALLLFLFALPISQLVTSSVGCTAGSNGAAASCPANP